MDNLLRQRCKLSIIRLIFELMFELYGKVLNIVVLYIFFEERSARTLYLRSATAKGIMNCREVFSMIVLKVVVC